MAKNRYINTAFWDDNYTGNLDPSEKLLFIYLLTNPLTNISGIYEIQLRRISYDTGFDQEMVKKILARFEHDQKVFYEVGWVVIKNFLKHQKLNPSTATAVINHFNGLPVSLRQQLLDENNPKFVNHQVILRGYIQAVDTLSHNLNPNTNSNLTQTRIGIEDNKSYPKKGRYESSGYARDLASRKRMP